jgi:hypothetical protein
MLRGKRTGRSAKPPRDRKRRDQAERIKWVTSEDAAGPSADFVRNLWIDSGFRAEDFFGPVYSHYDATFLLGLALAQAKSTDGVTLAEAMRDVANAP